MRTTRTALLLVAAVALLAAALSAAGCSAGPRVPDVTGKTADDAVRVLQDAGYKLGATSRIYTPGVPPGTVYQQDPAAGSLKPQGTAVAIRVAIPLADFTVPNVTGKTAEEASAAIGAAQLVGVRVDQYSETVPVGTVMGQVPAPEAKVALGATVYYQVSSGKQPSSAKVPNVVGKTQADADKAIASAGLKSLPQKVYSDTVAKGSVIAQSPAAATVVSPGATVTYAVSLGKPASSVTVPNVTGKSEAEAKSALQAAGLVAQSIPQVSSTVAKGVVIGQMPPANSKTAPGGTVGIVVSTGPDAMVTVPDVTGKTAADAKSAIEAAGLTVQSTDQPSDTVTKDNVITQLPVGGSKVPVGSTVVIAVSTGTP